MSTGTENWQDEYRRLEAAITSHRDTIRAYHKAIKDIEERLDELVAANGEYRVGDIVRHQKKEFLISYIRHSFRLESIPEMFCRERTKTGWHKSIRRLYFGENSKPEIIGRVEESEKESAQ